MMKIKDLILIAVVLAVIGVSFLVSSVYKKEGDYVIVRVDGKQVEKYDLSKNGQYELNGGTNILCIEDGKAYLRYSECPDQTCVLGKSFYGNKISYVNQEISCLPNNVLIRVVGEVTDDNGGVDF